MAGALNQLRAVSIRPNPPVLPNGFPTEWEYADDVDFSDEDPDALKTILSMGKVILSEWNLFMNEEKTETTLVYIAQKDEVNSDGNPVYGNEGWRTRKALGSLLCTSKDIERRCQLGNAAFATFRKLWLQGHKITIERKLKLYNAQVVSIMLYNCNSWSATKAYLKKLDVTHRKHLRQIFNIHWPKSNMSNVTLYKRSNSVPLSTRVEKLSWDMFGHILRGV